MVERILEDICVTHSFNAVCLRYFNAAGAHKSGNIGEYHDPETHLIPNVLRSTRGAKKLQIYGNDYETHDGTCIRDYIHVSDLADAHLLGFNYILDNLGFHTFNLGNGNGFSVLDVIKSCERVLGRVIDYDVRERRLGDPPFLVADNTLAHDTLGWKPKMPCLEEIVKTAWRWHQKH